MNKCITLLLPFLLFQCGCAQKAEGDLLTRIKQLEAQQQLATETIKDLVAQSQAYQSQAEKRFADLQNVMLVQSTNVDIVGQLFIDHVRSPLLHSPTRTPVNGSSIPQPKQSPMRDGVPLAIYNSFAIQAIKQWPGNYQKQEAFIQGEIENYKRLHP